MKKKEILIVIMLLVFIGCAFILFRNNENTQENSDQPALDDGELLVSSKEGYNSVEIYKQGDVLVICAESESAFLMQSG